MSCFLYIFLGRKYKKLNQHFYICCCPHFLFSALQRVKKDKIRQWQKSSQTFFQLNLLSPSLPLSHSTKHFYILFVAGCWWMGSDFPSFHKNFPFWVWSVFHRPAINHALRHFFQTKKSKSSKKIHSEVF